MVQAAAIALFLGYFLKDTPAGADTKLWPYLLAGWGVLASVMPWFLGHFVDDDFTLRQSVWVAVIFALPLAVGARWLDGTPYHAISVGCWVLVALAGVHMLVSLGVRLWKGPRPPDTPPAG